MNINSPTKTSKQKKLSNCAYSLFVCLSLPSSCSLPPLLPLCFYSQGSASEAHCGGSGLCELAGSSHGAAPRRGLCDQPVVSDGLRVAPGSDHSAKGGGSAVAPAHW